MCWIFRRHLKSLNDELEKEEREKEKQEKEDNRGPRAEMGIEKGETMMRLGRDMDVANK